MYSISFSEGMGNNQKRNWFAQRWPHSTPCPLISWVWGDISETSYRLGNLCLAQGLVLVSTRSVCGQGTKVSGDVDGKDDASI